MIIHCTTPQQIEDVIKTEGLILSKTDVNTLAWYVGTEKFEVCIDAKNSTWYESRNAKSTITPYADWKENEMKDQFIQLEGGKLNIAKAKELGLFVEDKTVFTVDEDCEIKYNEYVIESYESLGLGRCVCISDRTSKHVVIINPTPDKVRHEFSYYGIEVDVI